MKKGIALLNHKPAEWMTLALNDSYIRNSSFDNESSMTDAKREASCSVSKARVKSMPWGLEDLSDDRLWPKKPLLSRDFCRVDGRFRCASVVNIRR